MLRDIRLLTDGFEHKLIIISSKDELNPPKLIFSCTWSVEHLELPLKLPKDV